MVNIKSKRCIFLDCQTIAIYGYPNTKDPLYCLQHKEKSMVNIKCKKCIFLDCQIQPTYGLPGHPPTHCTIHKQVNEKANPMAKCQIPKCKNLALFGYTYATHCAEHKAEQEIDLIQKRCVSCSLLDIVDENGCCSTCDPSLFLRVRLAKQKRVRDFFDYHHMSYISYDRVIDQGVCGKERPDFIFDCQIHMIVVEVDENQHDGYIYECERRRMINIGSSLGMQVIFIRYNPDKYHPSVGKTENNQQKRMETLKHQIEYWQMTPLPTEGFCFVTYLYYDEDDPTHWKTPIKLC
jgi:very-short-patch-repair endonuclease